MHSQRTSQGHLKVCVCVPWYVSFPLAKESRFLQTRVTVHPFFSSRLSLPCFQLLLPHVLHFPSHSVIYLQCCSSVWWNMNRNRKAHSYFAVFTYLLVPIVSTCCSNVIFLHQTAKGATDLPLLRYLKASSEERISQSKIRRRRCWINGSCVWI